MRSLNCFVALCLVISSLPLSTTAFAREKLDRKAAMSMREERMDEYVKKGVRAFKAEEYRAAAIFFEKAFRAKPLYILLKNSMVAWYKYGDCVEAAKTAAKLVSIVGVEELSGKLDSEVTTVVNCALDEVDRHLREVEVDEARQLLTIVGSTQPGLAERNRINKAWASIEDVIDANEVPIEESMKFDDVAHYVGGGLIAAGLAQAIAGTVLLTQDDDNQTAGVFLVSFGLPTILIGSGLLVYWAYSLKKETTFFAQQLDAPPNVVLPQVDETPTVSEVRLLPAVGTDGAAASLSLTF